jgi:hypothetical protein
MTTHYPSRQEVAQRQSAELERLRRETVSAEYETPASPPIYYLAVVGEKGYAATKPGAVATSPFLGEHIQLLRRAIERPSEGLANHYRAIGVGIAKGNSLLRDLKAAGCLIVRKEKSTYATGGRPRKVMVICQQGIEMLQAYEQRK